LFILAGVGKQEHDYTAAFQFRFVQRLVSVFLNAHSVYVGGAFLYETVLKYLGEIP
jgi:hypothetical protein